MSTAPRPGAVPFTERTPRVAAARALSRRVGRQRAGRFLVEGTQAVREALTWPGEVHELFVTEAFAARDTELHGLAAARGVEVSLVTDRAMAGLSDTVTPQGVVAVCSFVDVPLATALAGTPSLVAVLVEVSDPGNAGTVIRVADAAGADAVVLAGDAVDPHNGKCVRASTGSVFHLPIARASVDETLAACRVAGLRLVATDGYADSELTPATAPAPVAWLFGSEAHGLPDAVKSAADMSLRVPLYGKAESLNLATAATVCLYASAWRAHGSPDQV
ncbi:TrmH family RNA methyltransferase [Actinophytocola sp. KF-1]